MSETIERVPAEVFPLAEILCDEMLARGWKTEDVARRMGGTARDMAVNLLAVDLLMCIQEDDLLVGDELFAGLAKAFGTSERYFRNLDAVWRKHADRRSPFEAPESIFGPISRRASFHVVPRSPL